MKRKHQTAAPLPSQPTARSIAKRIRTLRRERGWSLADVEDISDGSVKAVVLGSYERGDRAMSLNRVIQLANLFSVPLAYLLSAPEEIPVVHAIPALMLDLRRAKSLSENSLEQDDPTLLPFTTFITWIASRRCDWNGEVMSLRTGDLSILALMTNKTEGGLSEWLAEKKLLITALNRP